MEEGLQVSAYADALRALTMDVIRRQGRHCFHSLIKAVTNVVTSFAVVNGHNYLCQVKLKDQFHIYLKPRDGNY